MTVFVGKYILPDRERMEWIRSIDTLCDMLVIYSNINLSWWTEHQNDVIRLGSGDSILFEGFISTFTDITETGKVLVVCRDKTADLVDCPYLRGSGEFKQVTSLSILTSIASAFDIKVLNSLSGVLVPSFGYLLDEKCSTIISRLAQLSGWVVTSNGKDSLLHWSVSEASLVETIHQGRNANIRLKFDNTKHFSSFIGLGQSSFLTGQPSLTSTFSGSSLRHRPFVHVSENVVDVSSLSTETEKIKNYVEGSSISSLIEYYGNSTSLIPGQLIQIITEGYIGIHMVTKMTVSKQEKPTILLETALPKKHGGI